MTTAMKCPVCKRESVVEIQNVVPEGETSEIGCTSCGWIGQKPRIRHEGSTI